MTRVPADRPRAVARNSTWIAAVAWGRTPARVSGALSTRNGPVVVTDESVRIEPPVLVIVTSRSVEPPRTSGDWGESKDTAREAGLTERCPAVLATALSSTTQWATAAGELVVTVSVWWKLPGMEDRKDTVAVTDEPGAIERPTAGRPVIVKGGPVPVTEVTVAVSAPKLVKVTVAVLVLAEPTT